ncbi:MAG: c-type cytochrome biogenesis protein CcmI [Paracoccaceae bacterium]|nr:c-type cytochrome biogenesis protein CcmI [Paracoccaceae bacterium]
MLFWLISGAIALTVAFILANAFRAAGRSDSVSPAASDIAVYRDQLAEVDRDVAKGVVTVAEAEAVRLEISRRLLDADKRNTAPGTSERPGFPSLGIALMAAILMGAGFGTYLLYGAPGLGDRPIAERLAAADAARETRPLQDEAEERAQPFWPEAPEPTAEFAELMERLRAAVAERPGDLQGLRLLAQNEARLGNFSDARQAQGQLVAALGLEAPIEEEIAFLDLMIFAAGGLISREAAEVLTRIEARDAERGEARYYRGLLEAQVGRPDIAFPIWRRLLETSPSDAPWVPVIRAEIQAVAAAAGIDYVPPDVRQPSAEDIAATEELSEEDRNAMIQGMVAGLADRLANHGGPPADWARLITALGVMGDLARADEIAREASLVFADDPEALELIRQAAERAGVAE